MSEWEQLPLVGSFCAIELFATRCLLEFLEAGENLLTAVTVVPSFVPARIPLVQAETL